MNILHVYRTYYPDSVGGLEQSITQLCMGTKVMGVSNRVIALSPSPSPKIVRHNGIPVVRSRSFLTLQSCDIGFMAAFGQFKKLSEWADVIHYHFPWPFADALQLFVNPPKPKVLTYHSDIVNKGLLGLGYKFFIPNMMKNMDAIVATSEQYKESSEILNSLPIQCKNNVQVIPLGINECSYVVPRSLAKDVDIFEQYGLEENSYFLFVGKERKYKSVEYLLKAAVATGLNVVFVGELEKKSLVTSYSCKYSNIHQVGLVSDTTKIALLEGCRAFVLPSSMRSEAYGMVLVEASMVGKPMITCDINTGTSFINQNNLTGFVVPPNSETELGLAMERLINNDSLANQMGRAARLRYEGCLAGNIMAQRYFELYRNVINSHESN